MLKIGERLMAVQWERRSKQFILAFADLILVSTALTTSYLLRFDFNIPFQSQIILKKTLLILIIIRLVCFYFFSLYQGVLRYASVRDLIKIVQAISLGSLIFAAIVYFIPRYSYPRSIIIMDWLLAIALISMERFSIRIFRGIFHVKIGDGKRALIIGAGDAGEKLLREILENQILEYNPIGFIDDNPEKIGKQIHNIKVLGNTNSLHQIVKEKDIEQVLIAIPSAPGKIMRKIIKQCEEANISFKTIPGIGDLVDGKVHVSQIRDVNVEDLLRRPPININMEEISSYLSNKTILITGAGGSIGSELSRQISRFKPKTILLLDHEETSIYHIEKELEKKETNINLVPIVASVRDRNKINKIMQNFHPQVVFHAAAYKHVPLMEKNIDEAIKTNIFGTRIVALEAKAINCEKFVLISSDKAVNPTNVMGTTKRICELVIENIGKDSFTKFVSVRFGNVMGSRGSVIPLFKKQIAHGGPVEVTHPDVIRFFMTIPESVQLVLQAGAIGNQTEIFVLDMGEPVKIVELARDLIKLSGLKPDEDIEIIYTGLRPGEKLYEELLTQEEGIHASRCKQIFVARQDIIDSKKFEYALLELEKLTDLYKYNPDELILKMQEIVPGYKPDIENLKQQYKNNQGQLIKLYGEQI